MGGDKVKLIGIWQSPFVLRVKWALSLKGVEYEYVEDDILNKSSMLLQYNPVYKKVPVLVHNGKPIVESLVILEYIDETWRNHPLLPEDPFEKARSRFWAKFVDDKFVPIIIRMLRITPDQKENVAKEAREILKTLEGSLNPSKPFSGCQNLSFMDISIVWVGYYFQMFEKMLDVKLLDEENTPLLNKWFRDVLDLQVIKECVPPFDKLVAHYTDFHERHMAPH
ncbi:glutathione S-transferase U7-like [Bidens hawaiensis]|uniref:glutathione S-transferase U7-like n=1 Tax=Bidens hawaiensis TaxID=980011 RepID=UPI00404A1553